MPNVERLKSYFQGLASSNRQGFRDLCESVIFKTSEVEDGASAVAHYLDSPAYTTPGAKLLSLRNATVEKFSVGYDGRTTIRGADTGVLIFAAYANSTLLLQASRYAFVMGDSAHGPLIRLESGVYATQPAYSFASSTGTGMYMPNEVDTLAFATSSVERMRISSLGAVTLTQTWNAGLVTFTAIKLNVTDTASASGSLLADFQVGGVSKTSISKAGYVVAVHGHFGYTDTNWHLSAASALIYGGFWQGGGTAEFTDKIIQTNAGVNNYLLGNVGIGTTSPDAGYTLTLVQPDNGDYSGIRLFANNLSQDVKIGWHQFNATYQYQFYAPDFQFLTTGGVAVYGGHNDATLSVLLIANTGSGRAAGMKFKSLTTGMGGPFDSGRIVSTFDGVSFDDSRITFQNAVTTDTWTDTMTLKAGRVGIGTTSPGAKLDVVGDVRSNSNGFLIDTGLGYSLGVASNPAVQVVRFGGQNLTELQFWTGYSYTNLSIDGIAGGMMTLAPVWNAGATTFTGLKVNVTDTASASGSLLMDLQVGGTSRASVKKDGGVFGAYYIAGDNGFQAYTTPATLSGGLVFLDTTGLTLKSGGVVQWSSGTSINGTYDVILKRVSAGCLGLYQADGTTGGRIYAYDLLLGETACGISAGNVANVSLGGYRAIVASYANNASEAFLASAFLFTSNGNYPATTCLTTDAAGILAQRNGTNAQAFRVYNTTDGAGNAEWAALRWVADYFYLSVNASGTGTNRDLVLGGSNIYFQAAGPTTWIMSANGHLYCQTNGEYDIGRDAYRVRSIYLGGNTVTASAPVIDLTQTWNAGAVDFVGILADFTSTASGAGSLLMDLRVGGSSMFKVSKAGSATLAASLFLAGGIYHSSYGSMAWMSDGVIRLTDNAGTSFTRLCFGGTSASEPAIQKNGTALQTVYADNSNYCGLATGALDVFGAFRMSSFAELTEISAPSAPAANTVRLYAEDNGAGKTRLMCLFQSGVAQQVAIEP